MRESCQAATADLTFDAGFLEAYTGGDDEVHDQVLELFLDQAELLIGRLAAAAGNAKAWHEAAHSLKGCARGVGANRVADLALKAEELGGRPPNSQSAVLDELREAWAATKEQVRSVIGTR